MKVAILDDYQNVAFKMADWSSIASRAEITVFNDHVAAPEAVIERLMPFDVICVMRERAPLPRKIIERLPPLKLIASTARLNGSIDMAAAKERGIRVTGDRLPLDAHHRDDLGAHTRRRAPHPPRGRFRAPGGLADVGRPRT
jgi:lactate dehydrogenase-like 2-hydroxyacid dehydrogenase